MGHQDSKDVPAITWRFLSILSILVPARHCTISKIVRPTRRLQVFHISLSPKKGNPDPFRSGLPWVLRLFVPLVLLFQFLGFCLWKCEAWIFGHQVLTLENFPTSTNWWCQSYSEFRWEHQSLIIGGYRAHTACILHYLFMQVRRTFSRSVQSVVSC